MGIENIKAFIEALWDWSFLDDCFGDTGIRVGDMDGIVERNDWKLCLETKGPCVPVKDGQLRTFRSLVKDGWTVLIIWGKRNQPEAMQIWYPHEEQPRAKIKATENDIKDIVRRWFNWANANGNVTEAAE